MVRTDWREFYKLTSLYSVLNEQCDWKKQHGNIFKCTALPNGRICSLMMELLESCSLIEVWILLNSVILCGDLKLVIFKPLYT